MQTTIPSLKLGTPFQRPSWRYDAMTNPVRYGLDDYCSDIQPNSGCIKRLIQKGVEPTSIYSYPAYFTELAQYLTDEENEMLQQVWMKNYRRSIGRKVTFNDQALERVLISWNVKKIGTINDEWFKKLILHAFNYKYDATIEFAINFYLSKETTELKRFMGYLFYAQVSDKDIALRWNISLKKVQAIRQLFFDFSSFPRDSVAAWALMRQMHDIGEISREDFAIYKEVHRLGELGIRMATAGYSSLTLEEKRRVEAHLGESFINNIITMYLSIQNSQDALNFNGALATFAKLSLLKEEQKNRDASLRLTELQIKRMQQEVRVVDDGMVPEDRVLIDTMKRLSMIDATPKCPTYLDLAQLK